MTTSSTPSDFLKRENKTCLHCGKEFYGIKVAKYCSDACRALERRAKDRREGKKRAYKSVKKPDVVKVCPRCGSEFKTNRSDRVYCSQKCQHVTNSANYAVAVRKIKSGRACIACLRRDDEVAIRAIKDSYCFGCYASVLRNGACKKCKLPKADRRGKKFCLVCDIRELGGTHPVVMYYASERRRVLLPDNYPIIDPRGKRRDIRTLPSEVGFVLTRKNFFRGIYSRPEAVEGFPCPPNMAMHFTSNKLREQLFDLSWALKNSPVDVITYQWWCVNLYRSDVNAETGMRAFERFKRKLKDLGFTVTAMYGHDDHENVAGILVDINKVIREIDAYYSRVNELAEVYERLGLA